MRAARSVLHTSVLHAGACVVLLSMAMSTACSPDPAKSASGSNAVERPSLAVFPSMELLDDSGHIAIPADLLPHAGTPVPVDRLSWRTGFSPVQTTVLDPERVLDRASLPPPVGTGSDDAVVLFDLTDLERIPALVETDAWPDNPEVPRLLVRPLRPLPVGHRIAVSVSGEVLGDDGTPLTAPRWFADAQDNDEASINGGPPGHYAALSDALVDAGLPRPVLATDFVVGDGSAPLHAIMDNLTTPTEWEWDLSYSTDDGDPLPEGTWIQAVGRFTTRNWLEDDAAFALDASGLPVQQGEVEAELFLFVPDTVKDAEPGTAPVWIFGHGIFSRPQDYLARDGDPSGVIEVARQAGAIVLATNWRGLTRDDIAVAASVGNDFGRIPELTDKLAQGVANTAALARMIHEGDILDDPILHGRATPGLLRYYGISLGGIEGATLMAVEDTVPHGVLHVPGGSWSTMLERSSNWSQFELLMEHGVPSPADRQVLYAASQLFWDVADPALHTAALTHRSVLWQGSVGDEQVPNLTTELVAGAAGATLLSPTPRDSAEIDQGRGPLTGPALVWFDPEVAEPPLTNRPAETSGAHHNPRLWAGQNSQTVRFLDADDPGIVEHFCGEAPCSQSNPGE